MVKSCSVFLCKQRGNHDDEGNKVTYHKVPTNAARRKLWLQRIRRRDFFYQNSTHIYVCSKHFVKSDFQYQKASGHAYLPKDIIPTRFMWDFNEPSATSPACNNTSGSDVNKASTLTKVEPLEQCQYSELLSTTTSDVNDLDIRFTCMDFAHIQDEGLTSTSTNSSTEIYKLRQEIATLVDALKMKSDENDGNERSLKIAKEEIRLLKEKVLRKDKVISKCFADLKNLRHQPKQVKTVKKSYQSGQD